MRKATDALTCTTVRGCTNTPEYEITASGHLIGIPWGKPPASVHLFACTPHLHVAQQRARNRTEKKIELLANQQRSLFDDL